MKMSGVYPTTLTNPTAVPVNAAGDPGFVEDGEVDPPKPEDRRADSDHHGEEHPGCRGIEQPEGHDPVAPDDQEKANSDCPRASDLVGDEPSAANGRTQNATALTLAARTSSNANTSRANRPRSSMPLYPV